MGSSQRNAKKSWNGISVKPSVKLKLNLTYLSDIMYYKSVGCLLDKFNVTSTFRYVSL